MTERPPEAGVLLPQISDRCFEASGTFFGMMSCVTIATQVYAECRNRTPSTISPAYASGFLLIYLFWTLYGLRFKKKVIWLTNGVGGADANSSAGHHSGQRI